MVDSCEKEIPTQEALIIRDGAVSITFMNCEAELESVPCPYPARICRFKVEAGIFREVCEDKINQAIIDAIIEIDQVLSRTLAVTERQQ